MLYHCLFVSENFLKLQYNIFRTFIIHIIRMYVLIILIIKWGHQLICFWMSTSYYFKDLVIETSSTEFFISSSLNITFFIILWFPSRCSPLVSRLWKVFWLFSIILLWSSAENTSVSTLFIFPLTFVGFIFTLYLKMVRRKNIPNIISNERNLFLPFELSTFFS